MKKIQRRGRPMVLDTGTAKNKLGIKLTWPSFRYQKTSGLVRGPRWRDMPKEILIPLQSLVSCSLKPPANRRAAGGTTEGLWRGCSSACPKGSICWAPVAVTQASGGSSVLSLLCAKDQTNEIVSTGQIFSTFSRGL